MTPSHVAQCRGTHTPHTLYTLRTHTVHAPHTHRTRSAHTLYTRRTHCTRTHMLHTLHTRRTRLARAAHARMLTGHSWTWEHTADPKEELPAKETRPPLSMQSGTWSQLDRAQEEWSTSRWGAFVLMTPRSEEGRWTAPCPPGQ